MFTAKPPFVNQRGLSTKGDYSLVQRG